jgi:hypothetical protein
MTSRSSIRTKNQHRVRRIIPLLHPHCLRFLIAVTLQDVRLDLAKEEAAEAAGTRVALHNVTLTAFLMTGLDLEEQQYVVDAIFLNVANPNLQAPLST